jgi:DNA-binding NarL/FixJ family response regulator
VTTTLPRVLAICRDAAFRHSLARALEAEVDFVVAVNDCGTKDRIDLNDLPRDFQPDLLILESRMSHDVVAIIGALRSAFPEAPLFLVTYRPSMQVEKDALAHGVRAVFAKNDGLSSLIMNARAVCSRH